MPTEQVEIADAERRADLVRRETIRLVGIAKSGHYTSVFSCAEILGQRALSGASRRHGGPATRPRGSFRFT